MSLSWQCYLVFVDKLYNVIVQSGSQDEKSVIFSHSVIILNQLLQNLFFLTFRDYVKIFLFRNNSKVNRKGLLS